MSAERGNGHLVLKVNVSGRPLDISVGDGKQTFKWLSQVILSRAKTAKLLRGDFEDDNYIVTGLRNREGVLINPLDSICDHVPEAGDFHLVADVAPQFESDEWGNPILNKWQSRAFVHSEAGARWTGETSAWRERMEARDQETESEVPVMSPRMRSSLVQIGDDFTEIDLETAFQLDWKQIKWTWLENPSPLLLSSVADSVKLKFDMLCNLFSHYCGQGEGQLNSCPLLSVSLSMT